MKLMIILYFINYIKPKAFICQNILQHSLNLASCRDLKPENILLMSNVDLT